MLDTRVLRQSGASAQHPLASTQLASPTRPAQSTPRTQHLLHLGIRQPLDLRQVLQSRGQRRQARVCVWRSTRRQWACSSGAEPSACGGGLPKQNARPWGPAHLLGVHQHALAGVKACRSSGAGRLALRACGGGQRRRRAARQAAPPSRAFLMSPLLTPSASSLSSGCTAQGRQQSGGQQRPRPSLVRSCCPLAAPPGSTGHGRGPRPRLELLLLLVMLLHDSRLLGHCCHLCCHGCFSALLS